MGKRKTIRVESCKDRIKIGEWVETNGNADITLDVDTPLQWAIGRVIDIKRDGFYVEAFFAEKCGKDGSLLIHFHNNLWIRFDNPYAYISSLNKKEKSKAFETIVKLIQYKYD